MSLRFDGKVAVVTGAGNGLGKAYAIELAKRGCAVVVNDLGGGFKGESTSATEGKRVADVVVDEIRAAGGQAVANYDSVENGAAIIGTAVKAFNKVDIVINNAGILRDISMKRMTVQDWDMIVKVHLNGVFSVTKAAWEIFQQQGYGRIVNVASPAGLYGNVGQANYATAKMGMLGFTQTLAKEGEKKNIKANVIAPLAGTRMLATVMPEKMINKLKVDYIVSLVLYLVHEQCEESGSTFECGGGTYQKVALYRAPGWAADLDVKEPTVEDVAEHFEEICDMDDADIAEGGSTAGIENVMQSKL